MANLASTYLDNGQWTEAGEIEVRVIHTSERILQEEYCNTLTSIADLASE